MPTVGELIRNINLEKFAQMNQGLARVAEGSLYLQGRKDLIETTSTSSQEIPLSRSVKASLPLSSESIESRKSKRRSNEPLIFDNMQKYLDCLVAARISNSPIEYIPLSGAGIIIYPQYCVLPKYKDLIDPVTQEVPVKVENQAEAEKIMEKEIFSAEQNGENSKHFAGVRSWVKTQKQQVGEVIRHWSKKRPEQKTPRGPGRHNPFNRP